MEKSGSSLKISLRIAEAEASSPVRSWLWYPFPFRKIVIGWMGLFCRIRALQYSTPSRLLGVSRKFPRSDIPSASKARTLAWGQESPSESPSFNFVENESGSSARIAAVSIKRSLSPISLPKQRWVTTPSWSRRATAPAAKSSALLTAKMEGISRTRSAPHRSAIFVRRYLLKTATSPRCTKSPLITAMQ